MAVVSVFSRSRAISWAITLAWATLVFYLSTAKFGTEFSERLVAHALGFLHVGVSLRIVQILNTLFRKSAHLMEYGILTLLLYGSFANQQRFRWRVPRGLWCVFIAGAYALTDEFHQMFEPGRNASLMDCGIDAAGAAIAVLLVRQSQRLFRVRAQFSVNRREAPHGRPGNKYD